MSRDDDGDPKGDSFPPAPEPDELPPLDDGAAEPAFLEPPVELDELAGAQEADAIGDEELAADPFEFELADFEDSVWIEETRAFDPLGGEELGEAEEEGWAEDAGPPLPLDDAWFDDALEGEPGEDDGGAAGPIADADFGFGDVEPELDAQYLGPVRGRVCAAAMVDGALLAAGDGLYRLGADGLLHRYDAEEELAAIAVCAAGDAVLLGTERRGVLCARGFGSRLEPLNGWRGGRGGDRASGAELPVAIRIFLRRGPAGHALTGLTEDGRLFESGDLGGSWDGPLSAHRCLAVAPVEGDAAILALIDAGDRAELYRVEARRWVRLGLPGALETAAREAPVALAAGGGVIALAADRPESPLYVSIDGGASWAERGALRGVTALAFDAHEPGWIAAATYCPGGGLVLASRDGGATWRAAFAPGAADEREEPVRRAGRVSSLAVVGDDRRRLLAVAAEGVYLAALTDGGGAH